jgi:hypothetical protein
MDDRIGGHGSGQHLGCTGSLLTAHAMDRGQLTRIEEGVDQELGQDERGRC